MKKNPYQDFTHYEYMKRKYYIPEKREKLIFRIAMGTAFILVIIEIILMVHLLIYKSM